MTTTATADEAVADRLLVVELLMLARRPYSRSADDLAALAHRAAARLVAIIPPESLAREAPSR